MRWGRRTSSPVQLEPMRAGEIDGRSIDLTPDLGGAIGDQVPSLSNVAIAIQRIDGFPTTSDDLTLAGSDWPNALDATKLILTIGLTAPAAAASHKYQITITVNKTMQGRLFIRDLTIEVLASMG